MGGRPGWHPETGPRPKPLYEAKNRVYGLYRETVAALRPAPSEEVPQIERKVERKGTVYTQNTARIGSAPRAPRDDAPVFDRTPMGGARESS